MFRFLFSDMLLGRRFYILLLTAFAILPAVTGCVPAIVAGATTGVMVANDPRTVGAFIDDASIEASGRSLVSGTHELEKAHINITSINGIVLLTGEAPSEQARTLVLEKIRSVNGVRRTINEMQISPPSSFGNRTKDTWITGKVKTSLISDERVDSTRVKVVTEQKVVYLMGLITQSEAQFAATATSKVKGVKRVVKLFEYTD